MNTHRDSTGSDDCVHAPCSATGTSSAVCVASEQHRSHREEVPLEGLVLLGVGSRDLNLGALLTHSENISHLSDVEATWAW